MLITAILTVLVIAASVAYAACVASSRADRRMSYVAGDEYKQVGVGGDD